MWRIIEPKPAIKQYPISLSCYFSPDSSQIAVASDMVIKIISTSTGRKIHEFTGHLDCVRNFFFFFLINKF